MTSFTQDDSRRARVKSRRSGDGILYSSDGSDSDEGGMYTGREDSMSSYRMMHDVRPPPSRMDKRTDADEKVRARGGEGP